MRLIDADALIERIRYSLHDHKRVRIDIVTETFLTEFCSPTINPDDLRPRERYRIDGHHIRFKCCNKVLSIVPNESDDYENLVSCPFCNAKMDGKENEDA